MGYFEFIESNQKKESISIQRVKNTVPQLVEYLQTCDQEDVGWNPNTGTVPALSIKNGKSSDFLV